MVDQPCVARTTLSRNSGKRRCRLTFGWNGRPAWAGAPQPSYRPLRAGPCMPPLNVSVRHDEASARAETAAKDATPRHDCFRCVVCTGSRGNGLDCLREGIDRPRLGDLPNALARRVQLDWVPRSVGGCRRRTVHCASHSSKGTFCYRTFGTKVRAQWWRLIDASLRLRRDFGRTARICAAEAHAV
jgi:hypothetical protein